MANPSPSRLRKPGADRARAVPRPSRQSGRSLGSALGPVWPWLLAAAAGLYLIRFATTGGLRQVIYQRLFSVYLLLPDRLVADLTDLWTDGRWGEATVLDRLPVLAGAAALLLASWSCGRLLLGKRLPARWTPLETSLFSLAVGLNVWSSYTLLLGLTLGFDRPWLLRFPMLAVTLAGIGYQGWVSATSPSRQVDVPSGRRDGRCPEWLGLVLVPIVILYLLTASLPPWEFDVREYHLQTPKEWYQAGGVTFLPHNVYGNMPLGAEMPALAAMLWTPGPLAWWWGALVGKVVLSCLAVATALAVYAFGCRYWGPWVGVTGSIVYLSTPWVFHVSTVGLVEGALGFYLFLALYALLLARSDPGCKERDGDSAVGPLPAESPLEPASLQKLPSGSEPPDDAHYALSGYLAGGAVACKYTGLVFVVLPLALLMVWQARAWAWRSRIRVAALFFLLVAAGCGLWFAKNVYFTGNPTYPLLYSVFGGEPWNEEKNERSRAAHGPPRDPAGRRFSFTQLRTALIDLGWYSDKLSPLLVPLLLFCLLERRQRKLQWQLAVLLLINFTLWWLLTHRYDRFFVPMFPVLAVLAGVGGGWLGQRRTSWLLVGLLLAGVGVNTIVVSSGVLTGDNRIFVPLEVLREDSWRSVRVHPAHRYLNRHVPPGHAALLVGEAQVFDLEVPIFYSTCWDDCFLELWTRDATREERLQQLRAHGVTHVFVHWHEIDRYRSPGNYGFTDFITREFVREELVDRQGILRPVAVPTDDGILDPEFGQVFEVVQ